MCHCVNPHDDKTGEGGEKECGSDWWWQWATHSLELSLPCVVIRRIHTVAWSAEHAAGKASTDSLLIHCWTCTSTCQRILVLLWLIYFYSELTGIRWLRLTPLRRSTGQRGEMSLKGCWINTSLKLSVSLSLCMHVWVCVLCRMRGRVTRGLIMFPCKDARKDMALYMVISQWLYFKLWREEKLKLFNTGNWLKLLSAANKKHFMNPRASAGYKQTDITLWISGICRLSRELGHSRTNK